MPRTTPKRSRPPIGLEKYLRRRHRKEPAARPPWRERGNKKEGLYLFALMIIVTLVVYWVFGR